MKRMAGITWAPLALVSCFSWVSGCTSASDAEEAATESQGTGTETRGSDSSGGSTSDATQSGTTTGTATSSAQSDSTADGGDSSTSTSSDTDAGTLTLGDASSTDGGDAGNDTVYDEACQQWCEPLLECGIFANEASCRWACEYSLVVHADWSQECRDAMQDEWNCVATQDSCDQSACANDELVTACAPHVGAAAGEYCMRRQDCGLDTPADLESCTYGAGAFFEGLLAFDSCPEQQDAYLNCLTAVACDDLDDRSMGLGTMCTPVLDAALATCVDAAGL